MGRRLLLCVGPHRSGTSVAAAALETLGAQLQLPAKPYLSSENPKGFYEHPGAVALNDEILSELGATWDTPSFDLRTSQGVAENWERWTNAVAELIDRILSKAPLGAIKDPRICMLAPIWIDAAERAGVPAGQLAFVFVHRDPIEVALSQRTRAERRPDFYELGRSLPEGAALWLAYTGQFFDSIEGQPVTILPHRFLLDDPVHQLGRLADALNLTADPERVASFARSFVDEDLYRSRPLPADKQSIASALPATFEVADLLGDAASAPVVSKEVRHRIASLWRSSDCQNALARSVLPSLGRLNKKARETSLALVTQMARAGQQKADQEKALARVEADAQAMSRRHEEKLAEQAASHERTLAKLYADHRAQIAALSAKMAESARASADEVAGLLRERAELRAYQRELESSTSWRITAPLRAMRNAFRQG